MASVLPENYVSFWDFSLQQYARPGVADVCLQLQDQHAVNVNLLLWCVWLERRGLVLNQERLGEAQQRIQAWDEHYVIPLRQLRRRMKTEFGLVDAGIEQVRHQIKQAELLAEKQVQKQLESVAENWRDTASDAPLSAGHNLVFYLQEYKVNDFSRVVSLLAQGGMPESTNGK